jgi:hypothetical protein
MCSPRQNLKTVFLIAQLLLPSVAWSWTGTTDSTGFTVDTSSRNDVLSFWQGVYLKSEGYEKRVGWTGSYTSLALGAEGSTSAAFVTDVERRTNFIRALCGVPADARFNTGATVNIFPGDSYSPSATTTKFAAAQRSALMIIKTARDHPTDGHSGDGLSHDPPTTCTAWTSASWNANSKSNLAYAFYGPAAVDAYFREDVPGVSAWNIDLGHRRWLLALQSTNFATGDTPGQRPVNATDRGIPPSNCLYVIPKTSELATTASARFVAYPAPGFFPAPLNSPYWSLSYPGANFNAASVTVTASDNSNVPTTLVSKRVGFGENAIVWQVPASVAVRAISADVTYRVAVTGIAGAGIPTSYSYSVTLINPSQLTDLPVVSGSSSPSTVGESYRFTRANLADSMEVGFFRPLDIGWVEGAEDSPSPAVVDLTDASYALRVSTPGFFRSGNKSFRLSLPTTYEPTLGGVPDQIFEFTREILPAASATLNLYYRRGFMAAGTRLLVETSDDGGVSWTIRSTVLGTASNTADPSFSALAVPLPVSTVPLRARFRLTYTSGALYTIVGQPTLTTGIYLDDISTTNCLSLEKRGSIESVVPTTSITFNSTTEDRHAHRPPDGAPAPHRPGGSSRYWRDL